MPKFIRRDAEEIDAILYDGTNGEAVYQFVVDNLSDGRKVKALTPGNYLRAMGLDRFEFTTKESFELVFKPKPADGTDADEPAPDPDPAPEGSA